MNLTNSSAIMIQSPLMHPKMTMQMSMPIIWKYTCRFLYPEWQTKTVQQFTLACFICFLLGFIMILVPTLRRLCLIKLSNDKTGYTLASTSSDLSQIPQSRFTLLQHLFSVVLYAFYAFLHILVMLIIMTVNGYVILSIMVGLTLGYSLISPFCDRKDKNRDCCHKDGTNQSILTNEQQIQN